MGPPEASRIHLGEVFGFPPETGGAFYPASKKQPCFFHQGDPVLGNGGVKEYTYGTGPDTPNTLNRGPFVVSI